MPLTPDPAYDAIKHTLPVSPATQRFNAQAESRAALFRIHCRVSKVLTGAPLMRVMSAYAKRFELWQQMAFYEAVLAKETAATDLERDAAMERITQALTMDMPKPQARLGSRQAA